MCLSNTQPGATPLAPSPFTLEINDFGVKYFSKYDANHLLSALQDKYSITNDCSDDSYLGLTIDWNDEEVNA